MNYLDYNVEPVLSKKEFNIRMDELYSDFLKNPSCQVNKLYNDYYNNVSLCNLDLPVKESYPVQEVYTAAQARVESDKYIAKTKVLSFINTEVKEAAKVGKLCIFIPASQLTEAAIVLFREYGYKVNPKYDTIFDANYPCDLRKKYSGCDIMW